MASAKTRGVPAAPRQMDESFLSSRKIPSTQLYRDESIHPCDQVNERNGFTLKRVPIAGSGRWNPKVTDAVKHLKANIKTYLNYYGAEFGDAGAREIAAPLRYNTACAELNLADNMIGDKGVAELAGALRHNQTLTALRLDGNTFGDAGAGSLAEAMRENRRLLKLSLDATRMSQAGLTKIRAALADNDHESADPRSHRRVRGVRSISASAHDSLIYNCKYEQNEGYTGSAVPSSYC